MAKVKKLTKRELEQFVVRRRLVEQAAANLQVIEDDYREWANAIKRKYRMRGTFDVNPKTGELVRRNGRS